MNTSFRSSPVAVAIALAAALAVGNADAATTAYSNQATFAAAAGGVTVETFEGFSLGAATTIASLGVTSMSGKDFAGTSVGQFVSSSAALPFPMFTPPLPSGTNYLSNQLNGPSFATGSIDFTFGSSITAIGAFIADSSPLGGFSIEVFSGATSVGLITVGSRTLPDSFVGITSTVAFDRARFFSVSTADSWGLDNLQIGAAAAVPEPGTYALMLAGLGVGGLLARRRRV